MSDVNTTADGAAVPPWRERKNLMLGGAVGAAVLLLLGYLLLFSGGSSEDEFGAVPSAANKLGANGASASPTPTAASTLPAVFEEDIYGDPFAPLYPAAPEPAATTEAAAVAAPVTNPGAAAGPVTPQEQPSEIKQPAEPKSTTSVKLLRVVDKDTVVVAVDGSKYESVFNIGTPFGVFVLVSTRPDEDEATFNYGDGTPFTLVEGESRKFPAA